MYIYIYIYIKCIVYIHDIYEHNTNEQYREYGSQITAKEFGCVGGTFLQVKIHKSIF